MTSDALVSIIVPVYGVDKYLPRCMTSLVTQTYAHVEIILIDDGSPDGSGALCDGYAASDARVRTLHQSNAGPSAARNAGIDAARGSLLTFVDPDDWVHPDLVAHLVATLNDTGAELAVCRFLRTAGESIIVGPVVDTKRTLDTEDALELYAGPHTSWMTSPCAKLFRAGLFEGIRFPVGRQYEDEFTTYRLVAASKRVALSDAELYYYFTRPDSATHGEQSIAQLLDRIDALLEQAEFFGARGMARVSGNAMWRAFLILRHLHARANARGDAAMCHRVTESIGVVAAELRESRQPLPRKVAVVLYSVSPRAGDAAIRVLQTLSGRRPG